MSSADRDERLAGAVMALDKADMGEQVNPADVKPGDLSQHWRAKSDGHATIVQVVHAKGVAKVDDGGEVDPLGTWKDGEFTMDETSDPELVGRHIVKQVARLGAHSVGGNDYNQDGAEAHAGIFTGKAADIDMDLEYYGRPNNSRWRGWSATFSSVEEAVAVDTPSIVDGAGGGEDDNSWCAWGEWAGETVRGATDTARGIAQAGVDLARNGVSRPANAAAAEDSGASAPAAVAEVQKSAREAVEELDLKGCDYRIQPDGTILYTMGGEPKRTFSPGARQRRRAVERSLDERRRHGLGIRQPRGTAKEPADPFPPCVDARVWTSGRTTEIWCRDEVRRCEGSGSPPYAWVRVKDGGAGSDAVALVGAAAADVFGGPAGIVAEGASQSEGIEIRHQPIARGRARVKFDWGEDTVDITPVDPDHFERTAYAIAGAIERELDVPQVRVIADPDAEAPIVIVVGGAVKPF